MKFRHSAAAGNNTALFYDIIIIATAATAYFFMLQLMILNFACCGLPQVLCSLEYHRTSVYTCQGRCLPYTCQNQQFCNGHLHQEVYCPVSDLCTKQSANYFINPLIPTLKLQNNGPLYSNMVCWLLMGGLLHLVQRGGA